MMNKIGLLLLIILLLLVISPAFERSSASSHSNIRVWLADVKPNTGLAQVCVDVPETFASTCRNVNASATDEAIPVGEFNDSVAVDAGIYSIPEYQAPINTTFVICVYVFKYENGDCKEITKSIEHQAWDVLLRINYSPVFYDEEDGRLYRYGQNYQSKSGLIFSFEHESVTAPEDTKQ